MTFDCRAEYERQHGPLPGAVAEEYPRGRSSTARKAPSTHRPASTPATAGSDADRERSPAPATGGVQPAARHEKPGTPGAGEEARWRPSPVNSYRREDGAVMVAIAPHCFVNARFLETPGLPS